MMLRTCSFHKNVALDVKVWELMVDDPWVANGDLQVRAFNFELLHFLLDFYLVQKTVSERTSLWCCKRMTRRILARK